MDEGADNDERDEEADDKADRDDAESNSAGTRHNLLAVLDELERGRAEHRRNGKKEAELGRGAPLDAEREGAHDRRPRTADTRDHRETLRDADADCGFDRHFGDTDDVGSF